MSRRYFGTDGVRGEVGHTPITPDFVLRLGYSAGTTLIERERDRGLASRHGRPAVLIGKDTRISGYMLEAALESGFAAAGVDVLLAGPIPTPAVAYLTRALRLHAGVVISASHNPYHDNGIKFFGSDGAKLPDSVELAIERHLDEPMGCVASSDLGRARRIDDAAGRYIEFCKSTFPNDLDLRGMKLVVDCAHGAAYHIAPMVFHELGAEVVPIADKPNGLNINDGVGATAPESLAHAVRQYGADLGIALDGDGDRLLMADASGKTYGGDELLYVMACQRVRDQGLEGVVGTLMTNLALEHAFKDMGVGFARAKVGDRYVLEMMQERGWVLGGENSGHLICLDRHSTGDGIISALQVLAALKALGQRLDQACAALELYPQTLINVRVVAGFDWQGSEPIREACQVVEGALNGSGRVLLRPSGTEPVLRVMVEGRDPLAVARGAEHIADVVRRVSGC
mgnify:CR=1 FL=1